jgi:hypothetical protein
MRDAKERALAPDARAALGEGPSRGLEALLDTAATAADADPRAPDEGFGRRAAAFDDELAAAGLGYFVDADVITELANGRRYVIVYFFRVARVDLWATPTQTVRALWLRRLDKLNWSHALLGFTRPTNRNAAMLLDQLEEQILTLLGPALADGATMSLFEPSASGSKDVVSAADRTAVEAKAGEIARAELGDLAGIDRVAMAKLGRLLGQRHALFTRWEALARPRGMTIVEPSQLRLPEGFAKSLEGFVPGEDLAEMHRIDAALDDATRAQAFASLRDALGTSVERHEVQHRLDALGPQPAPMPATLEARVGPLEQDGKERRLAASARAELSAYLAELARDARTPKVGLTMIARFLFDLRLQGTAESYAALAILEGLADRLGVPMPGKLVVEHMIDRRAAASVFLALVALPPERLREEASKLWAALFGAPLPELCKVAPMEGAPR